VGNLLFAVFGSAGDIFPSIAVALRLQEQQHRVTILAPPTVALYARAAGLPTLTMGTGREASVLADTAMYSCRFDGFSSWRRTCAHYLGPLIDENYPRTLELVRDLDPDLVVVHPLAPFGSLAAEELGIPWASLHLYPQLVPRRGRRSALFGGSAARVIRTIEDRGGLRTSRNPLLERGWSPTLNLSVHDPAVVVRTELADVVIGEPVGFPYWDGIPMAAADRSHTDAALAAPGPLLVATLGSFIGHSQPGFWVRLADAVSRAGWTGVLAGVPASQRAELEERPGVFCTGFLPMSTIAAKADLLLHHGGIGTTYAALLAARPALVMPHAFDQAFNGRLLEQAGVAAVVARDGDLATAIGTIDDHRPRLAAAIELRAEMIEPADAVATIGDRLAACLARTD